MAHASLTSDAAAAMTSSAVQRYRHLGCRHGHQVDPFGDARFAIKANVGPLSGLHSMSVEQIEGGVARFAASPNHPVDLLRGGRDGMAVDRDIIGLVGDDQIDRLFHCSGGDVLR